MRRALLVFSSSVRRPLVGSIAPISPLLSVAAFGIGIERGGRGGGGEMRRWDFYDAKQKEREGGGRKDKRRKALSEKLAKKKSRGCTEKKKGFDRS